MKLNNVIINIMRYSELLIEIQNLLLVDEIKKAHSLFVATSKELKPVELCKSLYLYVLYSLNGSKDVNQSIQDYFELLDEMNLSNDLIMSIVNLIITNIKLFIKGVEPLINGFLIDEKYCNIAEKIITSEMKINDSSSLLVTKIKNIINNGKYALTEKIVFLFMSIEINWKKSCHNIFNYCWNNRYIDCVLLILKQDSEIINENIINMIYSFLLSCNDKKHLKEISSIILINKWCLDYYDKYRQTITDEEFKKEEEQLSLYAKNANKYHEFLFYEGHPIEKSGLSKMSMKNINILFNRVSEDNKKVIGEYLLNVKYQKFFEPELIEYLKIIDKIDHEKFKKLIDLILYDKDKNHFKCRYIELFINSMKEHKDNSYCGFYLYQE